MKKLIQDFELVKYEELNCEHYVLDIKANEPLPEILPGQFVNVRVDNNNSVFLRRPLSIHNVDYDRNVIQLFVKRIGEGTKSLGELSIGATVMVYPLGNSYSIPKNSKTVLIGGGCGVAPLLYLSKCLHEAGNEVTTILGVRSSYDAVGLEAYKPYGRILVTTEDGSEGEKGYPTQHSVLENENFDYSFTCGPEPMMKAVAAYSEANDVTCEVSLENTMACGLALVYAALQIQKKVINVYVLRALSST